MNSEKAKINIDGELEYTQSTGELYTGPSESFYDNGNIQHSGQYEDGLMEGVWQYYYPDGKIFAKISHLMGRPSGLNETFYEKMAVYLLGASRKREKGWGYGPLITPMALSKKKKNIKMAPLSINL